MRMRDFGGIPQPEHTRYAVGWTGLGMRMLACIDPKAEAQSCLIFDIPT